MGKASTTSYQMVSKDFPKLHYLTPIFGWWNQNSLCRFLIWLRIPIANKVIKTKPIFLAIGHGRRVKFDQWPATAILCDTLTSIQFRRLNETYCHSQYRTCSHKSFSRSHCHIIAAKQPPIPAQWLR